MMLTSDLPNIKKSFQPFAFVIVLNVLTILLQMNRHLEFA